MIKNGFTFSRLEWEWYQLCLLPPPPCYKKGIFKTEITISKEEWESFEASLGPPPPCYKKGIFEEQHEIEIEKNIVVEIDQDNGNVVVQDDSKEISHEIESIRETKISSLDKFIGLTSFVDVTILCPLSYFSPSFVQITFYLGGIENRILFLTQLPVYKQWDPGISL